MSKQITHIKFINFLGVFTIGLVLNTVNLNAIANECGTVSISRGLSIERNKTYEGSWPFAVAIYEIEAYKLFCGGTLISRRHVLTGQ